MQNTKQIKDLEQFQNVIDQNDKLFVLLSYSDWNNGSKQLYENMKDISKFHSEAIFIFLDFDQIEPMLKIHLVKTYEINWIPTTIFTNKQ